MSHSINSEILENLFDNYQIYKVTLNESDKDSIIRFAIRDQETELVRHNNKSFFNTIEDAQTALLEIVYKQFEEAAQ